MDISSMRELVNSTDHYCFACSQVNPHGLQMKFYTDGERVVSPVVLPKHVMGWDNIAHGGIVSTLLDELMSWSSMVILEKIILTMNMTVAYKKPVYVDQELLVEGKVKRRVHSRKAEMEAFVYNADGELCAESTGIFALFEPEEAKRRKIITERHVDEFSKIIEHNKSLYSKDNF